MKGIGINDPSFTGHFFGEEAASVEFANRFKKEMQLSDKFLTKLNNDAAKHNFTDYVKKNLVYPPPKNGIQIPAAFAADSNYSPFDDVYNEAATVNPNFNIYNVNTSYLTADPLGFPPAGTEASADNIFNNVTGLKEYIHAGNKTWYECTLNPVFVGDGDLSPPPDVSVLPGVIDKSVRTVIQHGSLDYVLIADGSKLAIQNMTWGGARGFQTKPSKDLIVDGSVQGNYHAERKLTFIEVYQSGHMIPQDAPKVAYKNTEYLLGRIGLDDLGK